MLSVVNFTALENGSADYFDDNEDKNAENVENYCLLDDDKHSHFSIRDSPFHLSVDITSPSKAIQSDSVRSDTNKQLETILQPSVCAKTSETEKNICGNSV